MTLPGAMNAQDIKAGGGMATTDFNAALAKRASGGIGGDKTFDSMGAPALILDIAHVTADFFGFVSGKDCTRAAADMAEWHRTRKSAERREIQIAPGAYYLDALAMRLETQEGAERGTLSLRGMGGKRSVSLYANPSNEPVFLDLTAASVVGIQVHNLQLFGQANPTQVPFALTPEYSPLASAGDLSDGYFNLSTYGFNRPWQIRGSMLPNGPLGNLLPAQYLTFQHCQAQSLTPSHLPLFTAIGQFGQIKFENCSFDGRGQTQMIDMGPGVAIGIDWRIQAPTTTAENTATNEFTTGTELLLPPATPVRIVGSGFPVTTPQLNKGVTYYLHRSGLYSASPNPYTFKICAAPGDMAPGVNASLAITGAGTPGAYRFVQLWATALAASELTMNGPHMLVTGEPITPWGDNLPNGLTAGTTVYAIKTGPAKIKLAASATDALNGTAIAINGGDLTAYGFAAHTGKAADYKTLSIPYSIRMGLLTSQSKEVGLFLAGVRGIDANLHCEGTGIGAMAVGGTTGEVGGTFTNKGSYRGDGFGAVLLATGDLTSIDLKAPTVDYDHVEQIASSAAPAAVRVDRATHAGPTSATARTTRTTKQVTVAADGSIDISGHGTVFVNANATEITSIKHKHSAGKLIALRCHGPTDPNYLTFVATNNIALGGAQRLTLPVGAVALFELRDLGTAWTLVSYSSGKLYQGIGVVTNPETGAKVVMPNVFSGDAEVGSFTADTTITAPTILPKYFGFKFSIRIIQDGVGGRKPIWDPIYQTTLTYAGTAGQFARVDFIWNGAAFVQAGGVDWDNSPLQTTKNTLTTTVAADGSISIGTSKIVLLSPLNSTALKTILSNHVSGSRITLIANFSASDPRFQEWISGGNIQLPRNAAQMRTPMFTAIALIWDSLTNKWQIDGTPPGAVLYQSAGPDAKASYAPRPMQGNTTVTALGANLTINPPEINPPPGFTWQVAFQQDITGGRTVAWASVYKNVTLTGPGTSYQRAIVTFTWDGIGPVQTGSTGWYS